MDSFLFLIAGEVQVVALLRFLLLNLLKHCDKVKATRGIIFQVLKAPDVYKRIDANEHGTGDSLLHEDATGIFHPDNSIFLSDHNPMLRWSLCCKNKIVILDTWNKGNDNVKDDVCHVSNLIEGLWTFLLNGISKWYTFESEI